MGPGVPWCQDQEAGYKKMNFVLNPQPKFC